MSIGINTWLMYLSINEKSNMSQLYSSIFHYLEENKLNIFRWKLLQYIIAEQILYDYSEINHAERSASPREVIKISKKCFLYAETYYM
jgi:hypothetical protein